MKTYAERSKAKKFWNLKNKHTFYFNNHSQIFSLCLNFSLFHRKIFSLCLKIFPCVKAKFPVFSQIPCFPCAVATLAYLSTAHISSHDITSANLQAGIIIYVQPNHFRSFLSTLNRVRTDPLWRNEWNLVGILAQLVVGYICCDIINKSMKKTISWTDLNTLTFLHDLHHNFTVFFYKPSDII